MGSSRDARSAGTRPASPAAMIAPPIPQASTGQPVVTLSKRGIAWPPISLNSLTTPNPSPTPNAPAEYGQQQALGQNLAEKRRPVHAQRAPNRVFLLPLQSAHQQQGRDVPAGDQKHQPGGA